MEEFLDTVLHLPPQLRLMIFLSLSGLFSVVQVLAFGLGVPTLRHGVFPLHLCYGNNLRQRRRFFRSSNRYVFFILYVK